MLLIARDKWTQVERADGGTAVLVRCPKCDEFGSLVTHKINGVGAVIPRLRCGHDDCDWSGYVTLEGWGKRTVDTEKGDGV